jgi:hypothetical protein
LVRAFRGIIAANRGLNLALFDIGSIGEIYLHLVCYCRDIGNEGSGYAQAGSSETEELMPKKLTPERARLILQEHGMEVSLEQAEAILTFLRHLAFICNSNLNQSG